MLVPIMFFVVLFASLMFYLVKKGYCKKNGSKVNWGIVFVLVGALFFLLASGLCILSIYSYNNFVGNGFLSHLIFGYSDEIFCILAILTVFSFSMVIAQISSCVKTIANESKKQTELLEKIAENTSSEKSFECLDEDITEIPDCQNPKYSQY